jgi:hypothetical protein
MAMLYADRAFISVNGQQFVDVKSARLKQNFNSKPVPTMTPKRFNTGYVQGNTDIDVNFEINVENSLASPKLEDIDFSTNDVSLNFICGQDQYIAGSLFMKTAEQAAPGVGEPVTKTWDLGALTLTDAAGNSSLFNLVLNP